MVTIPVHGQSYEGLQELTGCQTKTFFSNGTGQKAKRMARQLDSVMNFYSHHLDFTPEVTLLVLSPADWSSFTQFPFYGMPHYNSKTLIVAAENNDYWKSMVPAMEKLPSTCAQMIRHTYTDSTGNVSMEAFFDLLAVHELGHAYTQQGGLLMQRKWMGELLPNILLHTYIAEKEPSLLKALTVFPQMVVATTDTATLMYTTIQELEANYGQMGPRYPQNYGWYQCKWHVAAGRIYDKGQVDVVKRLWHALKMQWEALDDVALATFLKEKVDECVAEVLTDW
ncbi:MAG: hypothetical protein J7527_06190 [Chitinophagaceae bacterium]|nr:hypothetical protein [Chitinophagaceae bacterium]